MKSTGIVRRLDPLGRLTIPMETRRILGIEDRDSLEIFTQGENIILRKYNPGCHCCGKVEKLSFVNGFGICGSCLNEYNKASKLLEVCKVNE